MPACLRGDRVTALTGIWFEKKAVATFFFDSVPVRAVTCLPIEIQKIDDGFEGV